MTPSQGALGGFGFDSTPPPRVKMSQVVIDSDETTYWTPLKRWVAYTALRNFYAIASNRKLEDKYDAKRKQIEKDIDNKYYPALKSSGLPVVFSPIPCPGATGLNGQGIWNATNVSEMSGGSASANTYDVAVTWMTPSAESGPSQNITIAVDANNVIHVDVSSLVVPSGVTSWNLYAGLTGASMYFQASLPVATKTYSLPGAPLLSGTIVGRGQSKDTNLTFTTSMFRG